MVRLTPAEKPESFIKDHCRSYSAKEASCPDTGERKEAKTARRPREFNLGGDEPSGLYFLLSGPGYWRTVRWRLQCRSHTNQRRFAYWLRSCRPWQRPCYWRKRYRLRNQRSDSRPRCSPRRQQRAGWLRRQGLPAAPVPLVQWRGRAHWLQLREPPEGRAARGRRGWEQRALPVRPRG